MKQTTVRFLGIPVCSVRETEGGLFYYWWGGVWRKEVRQGEVKVYFLGLRVYWARVRASMPTDISNERVRNDVSKLFQIYSLADHIHKEVFPKYRGCNKGKDIVLMASGPSLDHYNALPDALHLGVNFSFLSGKALLDYHFAQDYNERIFLQVGKYAKENCRYFVGYHIDTSTIIPNSISDSFNADRYVFYDPRDYGAYWLIAPNFECMPLSCSATVALPAAQFALWTEPRRLYLVGCDCTNGKHATCLGDDDASLYVPLVYREWLDLAQTARHLYPDTEIISINPVGLRGLFKDVYTQSFLDKNPQAVQQIKQLSSQEPVLLDDIL